MVPELVIPSSRDQHLMPRRVSFLRTKKNYLPGAADLTLQPSYKFVS